VLHGLNSGIADLIYLDPPFNTKRLYSAPVGSKAAGASFKDMWTWQDVDEQYLDTLATRYPALARYIAGVGGVHGKAMMAYLAYMAQRLVEMHRILKDTGSLYLHCDPTAAHYLKLLLDCIFGKRQFRNDISWCYTGPSGAKKRFPAKHDVILFYMRLMPTPYAFITFPLRLNDGRLPKRRSVAFPSGEKTSKSIKAEKYRPTGGAISLPADKCRLKSASDTPPRSPSPCSTVLSKRRATKAT
jgi:site-specific DNA-methyltransferase (adenine-specific)